MVFGKKKRKKETLERCGAWLGDLILKKFEEGNFFRSYSGFVDEISSLGYPKERVEKTIEKMPEFEVWNISGSYSIIVEAGEMSAVCAVMNSDGGM